MSLHYTSAFHRDDDPGGLIGEALAMGTEFPGPAEDILLAWSLRLPEAVDATAAARSLLQRHDLWEGPLPEGHCGRLVALLREAAASKPAARGRRRGWRGRRGEQ